MDAGFPLIDRARKTVPVRLRLRTTRFDLWRRGFLGLVEPNDMLHPGFAPKGHSGENLRCRSLPTKSRFRSAPIRRRIAGSPPSTSRSCSSTAGRSSKQVLIVPGDQGLAQSGKPRDIPRPEASLTRDGRLPSLPSRGRHRRYIGRGDDEDGEACQHGLPGCPSDAREPAWPGFSRPGARRQDHGAGAPKRDRGPVRWQVLRARRPGHPVAAPWRILPGWDRRVVLSRSQPQGPDRPSWPVDRGARMRSRTLHPRPVPCWTRHRARGFDQPRSSDFKIEVVDFPAFILVDDKGNDFFAQLPVVS